MSDRSCADLLLGLPEEDQEEAVRAWLAWFADADRLSGLGDEAALEAMKTLEEMGRLADAGRAFATGVLADRSRQDLGEKGLARSRGFKDPGELIARVSGAPASQTRRRLREVEALQPARSAFTGEVGEVPFPLLRAAVASGLLPSAVSAMITGPLAPLRERGHRQEQAWMRREVARMELELAVLTLGTEAILDHADVFDRVELAAGLAAEVGGAGMATSAVMLSVARGVGASRLPVAHERVRRMAHAHRAALLAQLAQASPSEGQRRAFEQERLEGQRSVSLNRRSDGLWDLKGVLVADVAAQLMLLRDAVLNPKRNRPRPADAGAGAVGETDADSGADASAGAGAAGGVDADGSAAASAGAGAAGKTGADAGGEVRLNAEGRPLGPHSRTLPTNEQGRLVVIKDPRSGGQRFHDALASILTMTANAAQAGTLQGANPTLIVTCSVDQIGDANGFAFLQGTHEEATSAVDASVARHAGCAGTVHTLVTTRQGTPLRLTSVGRIYTAPQREAIALRDGGCCWPGCEVPASWTEIHHVTPWAAGGKTTVDGGVALCWAHHRQLESLGWIIEMREGAPWFQPPPSVDPDRRWIRGQQSAHVLFDETRGRHARDDALPDTGVGADVGTDRWSAPREPGAEASGRRPLPWTDTPACDPRPEPDGRSLPTRMNTRACEPGSELDGRSAPTSENMSTREPVPEPDGGSAPVAWDRRAAANGVRPTRGGATPVGRSGPGLSEQDPCAQNSSDRTDHDDRALFDLPA